MQENNALISMTQSGDPLENAIAERVNGILKTELISSYYDTIEQAALHISRYLPVKAAVSPPMIVNNNAPANV